MAALPTIENVASRFAPYIEELHELFSIHHVRFGSPEDLPVLAARLEVPGGLNEDVSSILRSIILREGGSIPQVELLEIVAVAAAGPRIDPTATATQPAFRQLLTFVGSVARRPWNMPPGHEDGASASRGVGEGVERRPDAHAFEGQPHGPSRLSSVASSDPVVPFAAAFDRARLRFAQETAAAAATGANESGAAPDVPAESHQVAEDVAAKEDAASGKVGAAWAGTVFEAGLPETQGWTAKFMPVEEATAAAEVIPPGPPVEPLVEQAPAGDGDHPSTEAAEKRQTPTEAVAVPARSDDEAGDEEPMLPIPRAVSSSTAPLWIGAGAAAALVLALALHMRPTAPQGNPSFASAAPSRATPNSPAAVPVTGNPGTPKPNATRGTARAGGDELPTEARTGSGPTKRGEEIIAEPTTHWYVQLPAAGGAAQTTRPGSGSGQGSTSRSATQTAEATPGRQPLEAATTGERGSASGERPGLPPVLRPGDLRGPYFRVSSGVMASHLVSDPDPGYPMVARLAHIEGEVILQAVISNRGEVVATHVLSGHRLLRGAAVSAVKQWRYRPYVVDGRPVNVSTIVTVDFHSHR